MGIGEVEWGRELTELRSTRNYKARSLITIYYKDCEDTQDYKTWQWEK